MKDWLLMSSDRSVFLIIVNMAGLVGGVHLHSDGVSLRTSTSGLWDGSKRRTPGCSLCILNKKRYSVLHVYKVMKIKYINLHKTNLINLSMIVALDIIYHCDYVHKGIVYYFRD